MYFNMRDYLVLLWSRPLVPPQPGKGVATSSVLMNNLVLFSKILAGAQINLSLLVSRFVNKLLKILKQARMKSRMIFGATSPHQKGTFFGALLSVTTT